MLRHDDISIFNRLRDDVRYFVKAYVTVIYKGEFLKNGNDEDSSRPTIVFTTFTSVNPKN